MPDITTVIEQPAQITTALQFSSPISTTLVNGQGPSGPPGVQGQPGSAVQSGSAGASLNGHRALAWASAGTLVHASCDNIDHILAVSGVTEVSAVPGEEFQFRSSGTIEFSGWNWQPGPVLVGLNGQLVQVVPPGAVFVQAVGRGDGQRLFLSIQPPTELSA